MESSGLLMLLVLGVVAVGILVWCCAYFYYGRLWFRTRVRGCPVPLDRMLRMTFRRISAFDVITAYIDAHLGGLEVALDDLEAHAGNKGSARKVVRGMISAREAGTPLSFSEARALDLEGKGIAQEANSLP